MRLCAPPENELSEFSLAALDAARDLGYGEIEDMSAPSHGAGYGLPQINALAGFRRNAAFAYLADARSRPNLTIIPDADVTRCSIRHGRVLGVEAEVGGDRRFVTGGTYVLAAGALGSPVILMRSGVGPTAHLAECGVATNIDLPGVGSNLTDQPGVFMPLAPTPDLNLALARKEAAGELYVSRILIRAVSGPATEDWDLHLLPVAGSPLFGGLPPGEYEAGVSAYVMKPVSRGRVRLRPDDPSGPAEIDPAMLSELQDLEAMRAGLRLIERFAESPSIAAIVRPGVPRVSELPDSELRRRVGCYWHPVGTCAAGADDDPEAVVDPWGRVRGLANLRIADASILPTAPAANTQLPVASVAEMLAESLRSEA